MVSNDSINHVRQHSTSAAQAVGTITVLGSSIDVDVAVTSGGSIGLSHQNGHWQKHSYRQSGWSQEWPKPRASV